LRLKCTKFGLVWGSAPDPAGGGELTALFHTLWLDLKGPTSKRRKGKERKRKEKGKEKGRENAKEGKEKKER